MEDTLLYAGVLPTLEMYEAIEKCQKPVIASVNGFAVGGGNVLQMLCDCTVAKQSAVFRQVGPMMGSFDAGYGTWYLEDMVGKKKAKEIWFRNPKMSADEALASGSSTRSCPTTGSPRRPGPSPSRSPTAAPSPSPRSRRRSTPATAASRACRGWPTTCCCGPTSRPTNPRSCRRRWPRSGGRIPRSSGTETMSGRWLPDIVSRASAATERSQFPHRAAINRKP